MKQNFLRLLIALPLIFSAQLMADQLYPLLAIEDGDTLVVLIHKQQARIQLIGIDAPEDLPNPKFAKDMERTQLDPNQLLAFGKSATQQLTTLLAGSNQVMLQGDLESKDKYGRTPALAFTADGQSVNRLMVGTGYAITTKYTPAEKTFKAELTQLQQKALREKKGLWSRDAEAMSKWSGLQP